MKICRVKIKNFRNFNNVDFALGQSAVILGENQIGKTNLLFALRLILDPSLPDSVRQLNQTDFWDGLPRPLTATDFIQVAIDIKDFEDDEDALAILADHIVIPEPMTARLTYEYRPISSLQSQPESDSDYEFLIYGGGRPENRVNYDVRKRIPIDILHALRDVEYDLNRWNKSPLRPLLERTQSKVDQIQLTKISEEVSSAESKLSELPEVGDLSGLLNKKLLDMAGSSQAMKTAFSLSPKDPDKLIRSLRLYFDNGVRDISEASLGAANVLYLALRSLELDNLAKEGSRQHTFFAIEEPEAHLHPHLQRMVYRNYLRQKLDKRAEDQEDYSANISYFLTTHSPHIASVAPLQSLVILKKEPHGSTIVVSTAELDVTEPEKEDLERYLDVSRAETLFARAIILVEGDAEKFLIPVLAERAGYNLDALGITLCNISGTNFAPYIKLFGPNGLNIPLAILTDNDPKKGVSPTLGENRVKNQILPNLLPLGDSIDGKNAEDLGVFLNSWTFEIDLYNAGLIHPINSTIQETCPVNVAKERFQNLADETEKNGNTIVPLPDEKRFLKDIEYVGKGRFAQRLAVHINKLPPEYKICPEYILKGVKYVADRLI
jgi:putative ATP-dependent endonuclease of OLD family